MAPVGGEEERRLLEELTDPRLELFIPVRIPLACDQRPVQRKIGERPEVVIVVYGKLRRVAVPAVVGGLVKGVQRLEVAELPGLAPGELGDLFRRRGPRGVVQRGKPGVIAGSPGTLRATRQP